MSITAMFPEMKPRLLPIGSIVQTTYGVGHVLMPTKMGYWYIDIDEPTEGHKKGKINITDKDLIKVIKMAEF